MLEVVIICVLAIVWYRAGRLDKAPGVLWAALSTLSSFTALYLLGWGLWGILAMNALLFAGITLFRAVRAP